MFKGFLLSVFVVVMYQELRSMWNAHKAKMRKRVAYAAEEMEIAALTSGEWLCVAREDRMGFPIGRVAWAQFKRPDSAETWETFAAGGIQLGDSVTLRRLQGGDRVDVWPGGFNNKVLPSRV